MLIKVVFADSDPQFLTDIGCYVEAAGICTYYATTERQIREMLSKHEPHVAVIEASYTGLDGRGIMRRLRESNIWMPIILMYQTEQTSECAMSLEEGADIYLRKPIDNFELLAYIRTIVRRTQLPHLLRHDTKTLRYGDLVLDLQSRRVWLASKLLTLTPKAVSILEYLMIHPNVLISRSQLLDAVWGWDDASGIRAIDARIHEIRRAIGDDHRGGKYIETVSGIGYRFVSDRK